MAAAYRIPVRFKRVAAAFEDIQMVRARICDCESSGSDHSPDGSSSMSMDLSDMVNSFMEKDYINNYNHHEQIEDDSDHDDEEIKNHKLGTGSVSESTEELRKLMGYINESELIVTVDPFKKNLRAEIEKQAFDIAGDSSSSPEVKRRKLMSALREKGFDAGVCKSKWEKAGKCPPGSYEYIDVQVKNGIRYIIEVNLSNEFTIAHPTESYNSLISNIPFIFVGKSQELKRAVRIVSNAMKYSMKQMNMSMPPWRRHDYLQAKWFGSYRRTINEFSQKIGNDGLKEAIKRRSVGFGPVPDSVETYKCGNKLGVVKGSGMIGQLALAFNTP